MGDLLSEDDVLAPQNILYRCFDFLLDRKASLFSHLKSRWQDLSASSCNVTEGHEENEGSVNEFDAHSSKTKAE